MERKVINKEEVKKCDDFKREWVPVPEWNTKAGEEAGVYIQSLMADERDGWEYENFVKGNEQNISSKEKMAEKASRSLKKIRVSLVILCAVDETGNKIFDKKDAEWLGKKNAKALDRMYEVAQRINGMRKEDIDGEVKN